MKLHTAALFLVALAVQNQRAMASPQTSNRLSDRLDGTGNEYSPEGSYPLPAPDNQQLGLNSASAASNDYGSKNELDSRATTEYLSPDATLTAPNAPADDRGTSNVINEKPKSSFMNRFWGMFTRGPEIDPFFKDYCGPLLTGKPPPGKFSRAVKAISSGGSIFSKEPASAEPSLEDVASYLIDAMYRARRGKQGPDVVNSLDTTAKSPVTAYWIPPAKTYMEPRSADLNDWDFYVQAAGVRGKDPMFLVPSNHESSTINVHGSFATDVQKVINICYHGGKNTGTSVTDTNRAPTDLSVSDIGSETAETELYDNTDTKSSLDSPILGREQYLLSGEGTGSQGFEPTSALSPYDNLQTQDQGTYYSNNEYNPAPGQPQRSPAF
ncbi:hypothetical protein IWQ60_003269 [Tieghemiomyces parasiticus]|uniref:Uncharacterized protein n=1 Tax=Tieghemiomyces parasiticus TaxID=78921 RepID=A0A9W8AB51_9FUNG|nr:hypothetical protein IWQ60_003269 [Tieghemiomyces parasiticus]